MSRRLAPVLIVLAVAGCFLSSCEKEKAKPLFDEDYSNWKKTVAEPLTYEIPGHGAKQRRIFINDIGTQVKTTEEDGTIRYDYPEGTIIVKENYSDLEGTSLANLTIMFKSASNPDARRGWVWVNKNAATGAETVFTDQFCLGCHAGANESHPYGDGNPDKEFRDYVFFPYSPSAE